jgi:hypothetical protein
MGRDKDSWNYIWGNGKFQHKRLINIPWELIQCILRSVGLDTSLSNETKKIFLLNNRLNTTGLLRRENMYLDSYTCELCRLQREGALRHLFLKCSFAKKCWLKVGVLVPTWLRAERATRHKKYSWCLFCDGNYHNYELMHLKSEE